MTARVCGWCRQPGHKANREATGCSPTYLATRMVIETGCQPKDAAAKYGVHVAAVYERIKIDRDRKRLAAIAARGAAR